MRGQHRNVRYSRILVAGIALSVAAHFALFELGGLDFGPAPEPLADPVALAQPEAPPDEVVKPPRPEAATAAIPAGLSEIQSPDLLGAQDLAEYPRVLTEAEAPVIPPLVPRPRVRPERREQGFAPVRLAARMALGSRGSGEGGGLGITLLVGNGGMGGHGPTCHPTRLPVRYSRHGPLNPDPGRTGGFFPRR